MGYFKNSCQGFIVNRTLSFGEFLLQKQRKLPVRQGTHRHGDGGLEEGGIVMGKYGIHCVPDAPDKDIGKGVLKLYFAPQKGQCFIGIFVRSQ